MAHPTPLIVLAGGRGARLGPLTAQRAKPAVPFAGRYRIIDFVLSNAANSGYSRVYVLTQFMAHSLIQHLGRTWGPGSGLELQVVPAQQQRGEHWYRGTADAVYQTLPILNGLPCEHVGVFGGDHVYLGELDRMERFHQRTGADLTVAAFTVPRAEAGGFGVIDVDPGGRILGFREKPREWARDAEGPETCPASMGNYFFRAPLLAAALEELAADESAGHDFGHDLIPRLVARGARVYAYDFAADARVGAAAPYWRDVGTIQTYFQAHLDLLAAEPALDLADPAWPLRTAPRCAPPARLGATVSGLATLARSLVCEAAVVEEASLSESVLGVGCRVREGADLHQCLLLDGCEVGADARLRRLLLDKNSTVAAGAEVGVDPERDLERFPFVTCDGVVVVPKGSHLPRRGPLVLARDMAQRLEQDPALRELLRDRYAVAGHPSSQRPGLARGARRTPAAARPRP
ncbi:MAG: glucose-1-phosphate adenylyltransferase family protein [Planctomycetota bacterium]